MFPPSVVYVSLRLTIREASLRDRAGDTVIFQDIGCLDPETRIEHARSLDRTFAVRGNFGCYMPQLQEHGLALRAGAAWCRICVVWGGVGWSGVGGWGGGFPPDLK